ncbi:MAG: hypothetical protein SNJ71_04910, partial [Bacteroidales bacterium]
MIVEDKPENRLSTDTLHTNITVKETSPLNNPTNGNTSTNVEQPQKMTPAQRKKYILELKAKKQAEERAKVKKNREEIRRKKKELRKGQRPLLIGIIAFFVIITGVFLYLYFAKPATLSKIIPGMAVSNNENTPPTNKNSIVITEDTKTNINDDISKDKTETQSNKEESENVQLEKNKEMQKEIEKAVQEISNEPSPKTNTKVNISKQENTKQPIAGKLITPCWLISYSAVKTEEEAKKTVQDINKKGFSNGGYY